MKKKFELNTSLFQFPLSAQGAEQPLEIIYRPEKGLMMGFFSRCVIKDFRLQPTHVSITREVQTRRFMAGIEAYQGLNGLNCPFVPKLIDFSIEERWLCIDRIHGINILDLLQSDGNKVIFKSLLGQIKDIASWLEMHSFPSQRTKIKDLILSESGKLYLVDFELYSSQAKGLKEIDFYNSIIEDLLERIIVRRSRTAILTKNFMYFSSQIVKKNFLIGLWFIICFSRKKISCLIQEKFRGRLYKGCNNG